MAVVTAEILFSAQKTRSGKEKSRPRNQIDEKPAELTLGGLLALLGLVGHRWSLVSLTPVQTEFVEVFNRMLDLGRPNSVRVA